MKALVARSGCSKSRVSVAVVLLAAACVLAQDASATVIGHTRITGSVSADARLSSPPASAVWKAHWSAAYARCQAFAPATRSVELQSYAVTEGSLTGTWNVISTWGCRDTP